MKENVIVEIEKYLDDNDFKWTEGVDGVDYYINGEILCVDHECALDDKTNTKFNTLEEIKDFYNIRVTV